MSEIDSETDRQSNEWTLEQRAEIIGEANRILADPTFKSSKRCLALFGRLVDLALAGDHAAVKERALGAEVFGRDSDYDTATDPVVRMAANEIRKRLAQWYQEPIHHQRVRVRLTAGSYLLKFEFAHSEAAPELLKAKADEESPGSGVFQEVETDRVYQAPFSAVPETSSQPGTVTYFVTPAARSRKRWIWTATAIFTAVLAVLLAARYSDTFRPKVYLVWEPLLDSVRPLTLLIPDESPQTIADGSSSVSSSADALEKRTTRVPTRQSVDTMAPMVDAEAAQRMTRWLASHGQKPVLRGSSTQILRDLRNGPLVLIGGFNSWSAVLLSTLRYTIRIDRVTHEMWIQDAQNTSMRNWMIDGNNQSNDVDYAVVSRFIDTETGNWILSVGGLRAQGTEAGSDLLVDSPFVKLLPSQVRSKGNFQIVLKTTIINGSAGPPQILAFYTW